MSISKSSITSQINEINQELIESNENVQIETSLLLEILQVYGNDDLAFIVANYAEKLIDKTKKG